MKDSHTARYDEIRALARMEDGDIDTSDIPETVDWSNAVMGKFYRPVSKSLPTPQETD